MLSIYTKLHLFFLFHYDYACVFKDINSSITWYRPVIYFEHVKVLSICSFINNEHNGIAMVAGVLNIGEYFEIRIDKVTYKWSTGLRIGGVKLVDVNISLPQTLLQMKNDGHLVWAWGGELVTANGILKAKTIFDLNKIQVK